MSVDSLGLDAITLGQENPKRPQLYINNYGQFSKAGSGRGGPGSPENILPKKTHTNWLYNAKYQP